MKLTDLKPLGGIGANCLFLECGGINLVIDAGMHPKEVGTAAMPRFELLRGKQVDLIILTHCHLDHLGTIPVLMREHPEAMLVVSPPTHLLARRMLHNSCNVMMRQKAEQGIPEYPLFTRSEVDRMAPRVFPLQFGQPRFFSGRDGSRLTLTFHRSGHIPGAAAVTVEHQHERILFSGDVLFTPQRIIGGAEIPRQKVDTLVLETTRGLTERPANGSREGEMDRLLETIRATIGRGGSVIIPTFALGRMQELLMVFADAKRAKRFPKVPIFASGLGLDLADYFDQIAKKTGEVKFTRRILKDLSVIRLPMELKPGRPPAQQGIYLLSSGMVVENTPSYFAAAAFLGDPLATFCFVGYCDPEAPGGAILASEPGDKVKFPALEFVAERQARIEKFDLSSHADRDELVDLACACEPKRIILTHGDPAARDWFREELSRRLPATKVLDPKPLKAVDLV
jgi:Cft2 family RNA processing exonuclease